MTTSYIKDKIKENLQALKKKLTRANEEKLERLAKKKNY